MYLFGASGHGKVIKEILHANGVKVQAFIDDAPDVSTCSGRPVVHKSEGLSPIIVSIGANGVRRMIVDRLMADAEEAGHRLKFGVAIHPSAVVSPSAKIGEGTVVMAGAVINADAVIGRHCIINTGASVDHECVIGDYCHIAPGAHISGGTRIGEGTWIGVGACVIQFLNIGKDCMIGAGSVVVSDIPGGVTAFGNPCRVKIYNEKDNTMINSDLMFMGGGRRIALAIVADEEGRMCYAA